MQLGTLESGGAFTLVPEQAQRWGCRTPDPWNFLLLMFARAVEEGHSQFELRSAPRGFQVPHLQSGLSLARTLGPVETDGDGVWLRFPIDEAFSRLKQRSYYSPIPLMLDGRVINGGHRCQLLCRAGHRWGWTLVDRGLSFPLGNLTPGLEVVAQTGPLNGMPWPDNLVADQSLSHEIRLVQSRLRRLPPRPEPRLQHLRPPR